jgi:hypothetical protein
LVCNAGALLNEKTLTSEGIEVTFASHLLFGTYLLGSLAMPLLKSTTNARLLVVSSGGMYNTCWPSWATATNTGQDKYDGTITYAYAKRGQVLLCEEWAKLFPDVKIVTCHPGWTDTPGITFYHVLHFGAVCLEALYSIPIYFSAISCSQLLFVLLPFTRCRTSGVEEAFGDKASYLKPLVQSSNCCSSFSLIFLNFCSFLKRTLEEGSEGIVWLCAVESKKIESGAFYLDRKPQVKHLAGPFFTEGSATKNTQGEIDAMMADLGNWANGRRGLPPRGSPITAMTRPIQIERFMGIWYVMANIPTFVDRGSINNSEEYTVFPRTLLFLIDILALYALPSLLISVG